MSNPKDIAKILFNDVYKSKNSINLNLNETDLEYIFQVIVNIYIEGLLIRNYVFIKNGEIKFNLDKSNINIMNHYMNSIGFNSFMEINSFDETIYQHRYCSIKGNDKIDFLINPIFYGIYCNDRKLNNYKLIYKNDDQMIIIYFDFN